MRTVYLGHNRHPLWLFSVPSCLPSSILTLSDGQKLPSAVPVAWLSQWCQGPYASLVFHKRRVQPDEKPVISHTIYAGIPASALRPQQGLQLSRPSTRAHLLSSLTYAGAQHLCRALQTHARGRCVPLPTSLQAGYGSERKMLWIQSWN